MNNQTVRIIGGKWRGRKLHFPQLPGLRPTPDRVKETLFNWLMFDIVDRRCLDLYAGSGALGLEAYSRGAKTVVLVEQQVEAVAQLRKTLVQLEAEQEVQVVHANALSWLKSNASAAFDVIFLDPPFKAELLLPSLHALKEHGWVGADSLIYVEFAEGTQVTMLESQWHILKRKKMGAVECALIKLI